MSVSNEPMPVAYEQYPPSRTNGTAYPMSEGALRGAVLGAAGAVTCTATLVGIADVFESVPDALPLMASAGLLAGFPGAVFGATAGAALAWAARGGASTPQLRLMGGLAAAAVSLLLSLAVGQVLLPVSLLAVLWGSLGAVWVALNPTGDE